MVASKNIIKKMTVEIETNSLAKGLHLKDNIGSFLKDKIFPELERYFDSIEQRNEKDSLRFSEVKIDVNINKNEELQDVRDSILSKIKNQLKAATDKTDGEAFVQISSENKKAQAFLFFLNTGSYPWWFDTSFIFSKPNVEALFSASGFTENLRRIIDQKRAIKRLIYQFEDKVLHMIVYNLNTKRLKQNAKLGKFPKQLLNQNERVLYWECIFEFLKHENTQKLRSNLAKLTPDETFKKRINALIEYSIELLDPQSIDLQKLPTINLKKEEKASEIVKIEPIVILTNKNANDDTYIPEEGIIVQNAGLILLHPFLKPFFKKLEFITENKIIPSKRDEAVHTLYYLACKGEKPFEHQLQFEKYLCNIPLQFPIDRHIDLSKTQKNDCDELLGSVLGHWTALKTKSVDVLRSEFLIREGKLSVKEGRHKLFIQRKTQDILLEKIPWSIGLAKVPWNQELLFIEW